MMHKKESWNRYIILLKVLKKVETATKPFFSFFAQIDFNLNRVNIFQLHKSESVINGSELHLHFKSVKTFFL